MRVPLYKPNKMQSARIEYRGLDSASNPYLAYAVILAAGLKGIENEYPLMPAVTEDLAAMTNAERRAMGYNPLPASLREAINITEESEFMAEVLGEQVFDHFLRNKRADWDQYQAQVTPRAQVQPRNPLNEAIADGTGRYPLPVIGRGTGTARRPISFHIHRQFLLSTQGFLPTVFYSRFSRYD